MNSVKEIMNKIWAYPHPEELEEYKVLRAWAESIVEEAVEGNPNCTWDEKKEQIRTLKWKL